MALDYGELMLTPIRKQNKLLSECKITIYLSLWRKRNLMIISNLFIKLIKVELGMGEIFSKILIIIG